MTRPIEPVRSGVALIVMSLALLLPGLARARDWRPELSGSFGGTFGVLGTPNEGGPSGTFAALWPVSERFSFGVMLHADDAGSKVDSLRDAQGHGLSYGMVEQLHRMATGFSWRLDAHLPPWRKLVPTASASWGYYRVRDDVRGTKVDETGSIGGSLGASLRWPFGPHFAMGAGLRYHRLFNDFEKGFVSAGLEGIWR